MMHRVRERRAPAPAIGDRIIDLKVPLTGESANDIDLAAHLGGGHL